MPATKRKHPMRNAWMARQVIEIVRQYFGLNHKTNKNTAFKALVPDNIDLEEIAHEIEIEFGVRLTLVELESCERISGIISLVQKRLKGNGK